MPRHLCVAPHLSAAELEHRARTAPAADQLRWRAIVLVAGGRPATAVGPLLGWSPIRVRRLVHRFNHLGPDALTDRRHRHLGPQPLLAPDDLAALHAALTGPAPDGGLWTGPKVAQWMSARLDRPIHSQRGWEALRRLGWTPQRPRPRDAQADAAAQAAFKKGGLRTP